MRCEAVLATLNKGYSGTTVAERNAACVHCRGCEDCHSMMVEYAQAIPPEDYIAASLMAAIRLAQDRTDPEWE